jgi:hypothetical protein
MLNSIKATATKTTPKTTAPKRKAPAKTQAPAPVITEAKPDLAKLTLAGRNAAAALVHAFDTGRVSVPIKPDTKASSYKPELGALRCSNASIRQAGALAVACLASGTKLADGAAFNRRFTVSGAKFFIENGCNSDCVSVGLTGYNSATGSIKLADGASARIIALIKAETIKRGLPDVSALLA